jgi:hypothetical protein
MWSIPWSMKLVGGVVTLYVKHYVLNWESCEKMKQIQHSGAKQKHPLYILSFKPGNTFVS